MNENINLVEILKDAPKGTKLYSPIFGECSLSRVDNVIYPIAVTFTDKYGIKTLQHFTAFGKYTETDGAECLLFPSKDNRDWSTFKVPRKHKNFELGQKVLVPYYDYNNNKWRLTFYSHYDKSSEHHITTCGMYWSDNEILSYEGNEDKLGKSVNK